MVQDFVYSKAKELLDHQVKKSKEFRPLDTNWWNQQILNLTAKLPTLQKQLFKYVDLYPTLANNKARRKFLSEYFLEKSIFGAEILDSLKEVPFISSSISSLTEFGIKTMSYNFIVDKNPEVLDKKLAELKELGLTCTLDILGELVVSEKEADQYFDAYLDVIKSKLEAQISVKLSSLYAHLKPKSYELNKKKLLPRLIKIFKIAKENGSSVTVDSEHYEYKDLFFDITKEALMSEDLKDWDGAGIVIQAYLKESKEDLLDFIEFARERGTKFKIRLVKGAYWDYERAIALQYNWEIPVYEKKVDTDANYEELIGILMQAHEYISPAIASHNMRSTAQTIKWAEELDLDKSEFEFQFLYGMLDPIKFHLKEQGYQVNVYLPFGDLIEGMAYLVRRLLENTANNSFVYQSINDKQSIETLLQAPVKNSEKEDLPDLAVNTNSIESFTNAANLDFSKRNDCERISDAIEKIETKVMDSPFNAYSIINSQKKKTEKIIDSINPGNTNQVLAKVHFASIDDLNSAIEYSEESFKFWKKVPWQERVEILESFAKKIEEKRDYYNAITILEAAKPWEEADAEISEAVDFLNYYAKQARELFSSSRLRSFPGEDNQNIYQSIGIAGIISPWNFPFAIMLGMTSAALVAGNTAIVKPSENTSLVAYEVLKDFIQHIKDSLNNKKGSGAVLQLLLGEGSSIGDALVKHKKTKIISFTGSRLVGMNINKFANENINLKKKVITEMGGKNAIIIDETADLDLAVPAIIKSAFSFAGQKCSACSRLIVVKELYEEIKERLIESTKTLIVGEAKKAETDLSAVIDEKAFNKIKRYIDKAKVDGKVLISDLEKPRDGYYVSPMIIADLDPKSIIIKEEIFGPILALIKAENLDDALAIANGSDYGLTGAFLSRSPQNIEYVKENYEVGNLYINQGSTGAIVSRQAFGGTKLSSIGYKAGGPNYLLQFLEEKTITENTMRHGMIV
ncbi:MAG: bifunctional proline dehydrogenase/L-glutamate gamma-semialdehyde dehydrogenase [Candidatus Caenarcaniphilales bacterium]|nr:bifunctional proline dehydrogenase/L-glutamate gamma-semialdehyde dehydrogenase [Candidatus Caenarcaniphilales bacterium]